MTIFGTVTDAKSGEKMAGTTVSVANALTITNEYGFYSLTVSLLQSDSVKVSYSFSGYLTKDTTLGLITSAEINIALEPQVTMGQAVVVQSSITNLRQVSTASHTLSSNFVKSLPAFLGEADVIKSLQLLPGVQSGNEGTGGIYVRGGGPDQNLFLLDGVPVYNATHLLGLFSIFNADAIKQATIIKGGFPARFGERLSSVVDVTLQEGNNQQMRADVYLGFIASKFTLQGPIKKSKSSFIVSARRSLVDAYMRPILKMANNGLQDATYYLYDINAKANFVVNHKNHFYLSFYAGKDYFNSASSTAGNDVLSNNLSRYNATVDWGNKMAVLRWNTRVSNKLFANITTAVTNFRFGLFSVDNIRRNNIVVDQYRQRYSSGITDITGKIDIDYAAGARHAIRFGSAITRHLFKPGAFSEKTGGIPINYDSAANQVTALDFALYVEDDIKILDPLKVNIGLRFSNFLVQSKSYPIVQPRVSIRYLFKHNEALKLSFNKVAQFVHLLTNNGAGLSTDLWVPSTPLIQPQQAIQWSVGYQKNVQTGWEWGTELFYKHMQHLVEYKEGSGFLNTGNDWYNKIVQGEGWSYGAEWLLQKKVGKTTGLLGYTVSWSHRKFAALNNGQAFPYKYDRRHDVKLALVHHLSPSIEISMDWVYGTGTATTLPVATYLDNSNREIEIYGARNNFRLPAYHRMDIGARFSKQKKYHTRIWILSVYNLYNRLNTYFVYRDIITDPRTNIRTAVFNKVTLFPILPSVTYQIKF